MSVRLPPGSAQILAGMEGATVDASSGALKWHLGASDRSWNSVQKALIGFNATTESRDSPGEIKATLTWKSAPGDGPEIRSYIKSQSLQAVGYAPDYAISISQIADPIHSRLEP